MSADPKALSMFSSKTGLLEQTIDQTEVEVTDAQSAHCEVEMLHPRCFAVKHLSMQKRQRVPCNKKQKSVYQFSRREIKTV